jgi:hypothetical protein
VTAGLRAGTPLHIGVVACSPEGGLPISPEGVELHPGSAAGGAAQGRESAGDAYGGGAGV